MSDTLNSLISSIEYPHSNINSTCSSILSFLSSYYYPSMFDTFLYRFILVMLQVSVDEFGVMLNVLLEYSVGGKRVEFVCGIISGFGREGSVLRGVVEGIVDSLEKSVKIIVKSDTLATLVVDCASDGEDVQSVQSVVGLYSDEEKLGCYGTTVDNDYDDKPLKSNIIKSKMGETVNGDDYFDSTTHPKLKSGKLKNVERETDDDSSAAANSPCDDYGCTIPVAVQKYIAQDDSPRIIKSAAAPNFVDTTTKDQSNYFKPIVSLKSKSAAALKSKSSFRQPIDINNANAKDHITKSVDFHLPSLSPPSNAIIHHFSSRKPLPHSAPSPLSIAYNSSLSLLTSPTQDWQQTQSALTTLITLLTTNPTLCLPSLPSLIQLLTTYINDLKSPVSKLAIRLSSLLFHSLQRSMDPHTHVLTHALLTKVGEKNGFIGDEIRTALYDMCWNVSVGRGVSALRGSSKHRNASIRSRVAEGVWWVVERVGVDGFSSGEVLERVVEMGLEFAVDGCADARHFGKQIIHFMFDGEGDLFGKVKGVQREGVERVIGIGVHRKQQRKSRVAGAVATVLVAAEGVKKEIKKLPPIQSSSNIEPFDLESFMSADWQVRLMAIKGLTLYHVIHTPRVIDTLFERTKDANQKVTMATLEFLRLNVSSFPNLERVVTNLIPIISTHLASHSITLQTAAQNTLDALLECDCIVSFVQSACGVVTYSSHPKTRVFLLEKLMCVVESGKCEGGVQKWVLPLVLKLVKQPKGPVYKCSLELVKKIKGVNWDGMEVMREKMRLEKARKVLPA